ncbi:hypothetical protein, partial [Dialister sp.]|uniref:hypothetical protein n=1 Tax=Dialister sp. TaxID=1955814 RepID=UPI002E808F29
MDADDFQKLQLPRGEIFSQFFSTKQVLLNRKVMEISDQSATPAPYYVSREAYAHYDFCCRLISMSRNSGN